MQRAKTNSRSNSSKKSRLTAKSNLSVATAVSSEESKSQLSSRSTVNPVHIMKIIGSGNKRATNEPKELSNEDIERQILANIAQTDAKAASAAQRVDQASETMQATMSGLKNDISSLTEYQQKYSRAVEALAR